MKKTIEIVDHIKNKHIVLDSIEEYEFYHWLLEGFEHELIKSYDYHVESYLLTPKKTYTEIIPLKTKTKEVTKTLFQAHEYAPDFIVEFTDKFFNTFSTPLTSTPRVSKNPFIIDIKGSFARNGGDRSFSINRKLMYHMHNIYIHKIVPDALFKTTWVPKECRITLKKRQLRKKYETFKTIDEVLA